MKTAPYVQRYDCLHITSSLQTAAELKQGLCGISWFFNVIVLRDSPWFFVTLQTIMNPHRRAKHRYVPLIGEKGLAVLKTGCLGTNQGVGLIACSVIIDTNLRGLARVENVERNGEFWEYDELPRERTISVIFRFSIPLSTGRYITLQTFTIFRISCEPPRFSILKTELAHCQTRNTVTLAHCLFGPKCCECNSGWV